MAVAALAVGIGGTAVDSANEFSSDARAIGAVTALLAAAFAYENADDVAEVADRLFQADRYVKELKGRIAETRSARDAEARGLLANQNALRQSKIALDTACAELERLQ